LGLLIHTLGKIFNACSQLTMPQAPSNETWKETPAPQPGTLRQAKALWLSNLHSHDSYFVFTPLHRSIASEAP